MAVTLFVEPAPDEIPEGAQPLAKYPDGTTNRQFMVGLLSPPNAYAGAPVHWDAYGLFLPLNTVDGFVRVRLGTYLCLDEFGNLSTYSPEELADCFDKVPS